MDPFCMSFFSRELGGIGGVRCEILDEEARLACG